MIFLRKNDTKIVINRHSSKEVAYFQLINNSTNKVYTYNFLEDVSKSNFFYEFDDMDFTQLETGEYTLIAFDVLNNELERTLLVFGDYQTKKDYYNKQENNRIVYERDN